MALVAEKVKGATIHMHVNDIIHRAMTAAKIPSRLEPSGLSVMCSVGQDAVEHLFL